MARRTYGTGSLYVKSGAYYGRWTVDGRKVNRRLGKVRERGSREGLTKAQAEATMRRHVEAVIVTASDARVTVAEAGERLIERMQVKGRKSNTIEAVRSTLRVHLVPSFGQTTVDRIDVRAVERFVAVERRAGRAPKSIRNYLGVLHSIFELAIEHGWATTNPVKRATKPEAVESTEIRFLSVEEVEALLGGVPDDDLGAVEGPLYLTAVMSGLRQGELLGLRWGDVDWAAGKIRVRRSYSRGELTTPKSGRGRAVPLADRVGAALDELSRTSTYGSAEALVFAHPHTGRPLDASKLLKRFKRALRAAGVREVRFHDLRHTFGTRSAAAGVPMRTLQAWMGHRDFKTTLIYADYSPDDARERDLIERAFSLQEMKLGSNLGSNLSETESNSEDRNRLNMRGQT